MEPTPLNIAIAVYFGFAFVKFMLCTPHVFRVVAVMSRLHGSQRGYWQPRYAFVVPALLIATSVFGWVFFLVKERQHFFRIYPSVSVMRDCIRAYREGQTLGEDKV